MDAIGLDRLEVLRQRRAYLDLRIQIKTNLGWETEYDEREREALRWAIGCLEFDSRSNAEIQRDRAERAALQGDDLA